MRRKFSISLPSFSRGSCGTSLAVRFLSRSKLICRFSCNSFKSCSFVSSLPPLYAFLPSLFSILLSPYASALVFPLSLSVSHLLVSPLFYCLYVFPPLSPCRSSFNFSSLSLSLRLSSCLCYSRLSSLTRRAASDSMVILAMNLHISVSSLFNWTVAADSSSDSACSATFLWLTAITFRAIFGLFRPSFIFYCPSLPSFW